MRTQCRTWALLGLCFMMGLVLFGATPARAADLFVEVNPSTVPAGSTVGIRASCNDNSMPATVESAAFGTVTVQPQGNELTAAAMVPENTRSDTYRVRLNCPDGRSASTMLNVVAATRPSLGPATGFGGGADNPGGMLLTGGLATLIAGAVLAFSAYRRRTGRATRAFGGGGH